MFRTRSQPGNLRVLRHVNRSQFRSIATVHHVRFKRPWVKNFVTTCILYGAAFQLWSLFVFAQFDETPENIDETSKAISKQKVRENQTGSYGSLPSPTELTATEPFFIPMGWLRVRDGDFYRVSDPEWHGFMKISRDGKRLQSLRDELATTVLKEASGSVVLSQLLGGPLLITGSWLIHHFPSRAPPQYTLSGLELGDSGISWTTRSISSEAGDRLRRCMQPLFVALATWDTYLILIRRRFFGMESYDSGQNPTIKLLSETSLKMSDSDNFAQVFRPRSQPSPALESHKSIPQKANSWLSTSSILASLQCLPLLMCDSGSYLHVASLAFRWRLNDYYARELHTPRRGTFYFVGPIGLKGPNGFCRVEVRGEYDPSASRWTNVSMQLKDLNLFNQKPLGSR